MQWNRLKSPGIDVDNDDDDNEEDDDRGDESKLVGPWSFRFRSHNLRFGQKSKEKETKKRHNKNKVTTWWWVDNSEKWVYLSSFFLPGKTWNTQWNLH